MPSCSSPSEKTTILIVDGSGSRRLSSTLARRVAGGQAASVRGSHGVDRRLDSTSEVTSVVGSRCGGPGTGWKPGVGRPWRRE